MRIRRALSMWVILAMLLIPVVTGCNSQGDVVTGGLTDWQYEAVIAEPLMGTAGAQELVLGSVSSHGVQVMISEGSFSESVPIALSHPSADLQIDRLVFTPLAAPYAITTTGDQKRTHEPVEITLKIDTSLVTEESQVYGMYFNDITGWDFILPDQVDLIGGTVRFTTYHFSTYAAASLEDETRINEFVNRQSVSQWVSDHIEDDSTRAQEALIREILTEGMGITDSSILELVTTAVIEELPGGKLGLALLKADPDKIADDLLKRASKQLAKMSAAGTLKTLAGDPGHVVAAARASAALLEGEGQEAVEHIAAHIVDYVASKTPVIREMKIIGKAWVKVVDHQIKMWESEEMEKAYQVYRDGASSRVPFWGYNVEAGNFEEVWTQMSGISTKITRDALQSYADARGIRADEIPFEKQEEIREAAKGRVRNQFEGRQEREKEIDAIRETNRILLKALEEKGLLARSFSNPMYTTHDDLDSMLRRLYQMVDRIRSDTHRPHVVSSLHAQDRAYDDVGKLRSDEILTDQLADLIWTWYNNGPQAYQEKLAELGLVEQKAGLSGTWQVRSNNYTRQSLTTSKEDKHDPITETQTSANYSEVWQIDDRGDRLIINNSWYDVRLQGNQVHLTGIGAVKEGEPNPILTVQSGSHSITATMDGDTLKGRYELIAVVEGPQAVLRITITYDFTATKQ